MNIHNTHSSVQVHDSSGLGVNGRSILITRHKVHTEHPVTLVYLGAYQLLQLFQFILMKGATHVYTCTCKGCVY